MLFVTHVIEVGIARPCKFSLEAAWAMAKVEPYTNNYRDASLTAPRSSTRRALSTLIQILRCSLLSGIVAWLLAFGIAQGNVLSERTSEQQSYLEFLVVKILWFDGLYWAFTIAASVRRLLPERFASHPTHSTLSAFRISCKLSRRILPYAVVVTLASVGGGAVVAFVPVALRQSKVDLYWTLVCCTFFVAAADAHTRHIFRSDTLKGQARELQRTEQSRGNLRGPIRSAPQRSISLSDFVRAFRQNVPFVIAALFAAGYVHVVSFISIDTKWKLVIFATCTLVVKFLTQEAAKHYLSKQSKPPTMRSMVVIVAAPTIMVDTQLRTVLLCQDSASLTLVGSVLLALTEVGFRVAKTLFVTRSARRILARRQLPRPTRVLRIQDTPTQEISPMPWLQDVFRAHEIMALHSAETYADMSAEYIAMGCSYAILFFFGSHPKFTLGTQSVDITTIVLQVLIELVVDFVASSFEIHHNVNFDHINSDTAYLSFFSAVVAAANIHISSGIYLNPQ